MPNTVMVYILWIQTSLVPLLTLTGCNRSSPKVDINQIEETMNNDSKTQAQAVATRYLIEQAGWKSGEFRVKLRSQTPDGRVTILWGIHNDDETLPYGSLQKSLELHIDNSTFQVVKVLQFQ